MTLKRPRLTDVARLAGVSPMTASRVFRGAETVGAAARANVRAAAAELGYVPNQIAGSLRSRRSGLIAVILPTLTASVFSDTLEGLAAAFGQRGYQMMIGESSYDHEEEEKVIATLIQRRPDALVIIGARHTPAARAMLKAARIPVVELWEEAPDPVDSLVGFSNFEAARAMARGLIARGRRRFLIATGPLGGGNRAEERCRGVRAALQEAGLQEVDQVVVSYAHILRAMSAAGQAVLARWRAHEGVDCVLCTSEPLALGALAAFTRAGVAVPDRVAITGFGDTEAGVLITPNLSTVRILGQRMGLRAAEIVIARLDDPDLPPVVEDVGYEIVWRESA